MERKKRRKEDGNEEKRKERKREEGRGKERDNSGGRERERRRQTDRQSPSPIKSPAKTSTPTTNVSPLDPSCVNKPTKQGPVRAGLVGAASSGCTGLLIAHTAADSFLCKGTNHGRKQPLSLLLSKIFIHSAVACKHNWCSLDEILIIRDFNDFSCCGWTGEANKEAAKVHPSTAARFPSAL